MIKADQNFISNINEIMTNGCYDKDARPRYEDGIEAKSKFITQVFEKYDLSEGEFPFTTLRNTAIKTGIKEILWIYQMQSNSLKDARELGIDWWEQWNIGDDTIGHRYGYVVKKYDLMNKLLEGLKNRPFDRGHIIDLFQYKEMEETAGLRPCAYSTLFAVREVNGELFLDMTLLQRSSDYLMANYINKMQYVAFQMMIASHLGYSLGYFSHFVNNLHVYDRHHEAANEILSKTPLDTQPTLKLKCNKSFYDFTVDDFIIEGTTGIQKLTNKLEIAI